MSQLTPEQARKKWTAALRSGEYEQCRDQLSDGEGYCCLGVACDIAVKEGVIPRFNGGELFLPTEVQEWLGLTENDGRLVDRLAEDEYHGDPGCVTLAELNDTARWRFDQIADVIEKGGVRVKTGAEAGHASA